MKLKEYDVTITETLQMTVPIRAAKTGQRQRNCRENWNQSKEVCVRCRAVCGEPISMRRNGERRDYMRAVRGI